VACRLKDFALSKEQSLELLLEEWNERCEPPWPVDELETKKRQDLYGVEWDEGADNALSRMGEPLIKNLLDRFAMSVVCGQSKPSLGLISQPSTWDCKFQKIKNLV
jgi:hypothetical protein